MSIELTGPQSSERHARSETLRNPIFVVGHPRSGTTLLRAVLSAHSQVRLFEEPDLILGIRSSGFTIQDTFDFDKRSELIDSLGKIRNCRRHLETLGEDYIDQFLSYPDVLSFREVFEFLLPRPTEDKVWGSKEPVNLFFVNDILKLYPNALIIHIVRDPRATLLSCYRKRVAKGKHCVPPFGRESIAFFAYESLRWRAAMAAAEAVKTKAGPTSLCELRYEDFVKNPERELRALCGAIGLEYESGMADAYHRKDDPVLLSKYAYAHKRLAQSIDPSRAEGGKELPDWASFVIRSCAGDLVALKGYDLRQMPNYYHRLVVSAGVRAYRTKMEKRLDRELQRLHGVRT